MILAIDTGGTKTLIALITEAGQIKTRLRFPTPAATEDYVEKLKEVIDQNFKSHSISRVVVALPGIIDEQGVARWCNNLGWRNFDAAKQLAGICGDASVHIENDANLGGLGEARRLSAMPKSVLYVTVSTGIGTGIISSGHIDSALSKSEGGRMLVEYDGRVREWETFASGRAIHQAYGKFARDIHSKRAWQQIADRISRGFLAVIPLLQPDVIIIGGSIGTYFGRFAPQLEAILIEKLPPHIPCPRIEPAADPEEAVIYGCYYYARDLARR